MSDLKIREIDFSKHNEVTAHNGVAANNGAYSPNGDIDKHDAMLSDKMQNFALSDSRRNFALSNSRQGSTFSKKSMRKSSIKQRVKLESVEDIEAFDSPEQSYTMRDELYQIITLSRISIEITKHPYFARLSNIKQLGPIDFIMRHGNHSRFPHSLGVAYLSRYAALALKKKHPHITYREVLCVEIAGLCHDLGHGPYSHTFDVALHTLNIDHQNAHHENRSQILFSRIIKDLQNLQDMHESQCPINLTTSEIELIKYFIDTEQYKKANGITDVYPKNLVFTHGLEQIVSNSVSKLDTDKLDYLIRDSYKLRLDQVIKTDIPILSILDQSMLLDGKWIFDVASQPAIVELSNRRYLLYSNVYLSMQVFAIDCMLTDAFLSIAAELNIKQVIQLETDEQIEQFCMWTDDYIFEYIINNPDAKFAVAKNLLRRIATKTNLYVCTGEFVSNPQTQLPPNYYERPWRLLNDKSSPENMQRAIGYHSNGKLIDISKPTAFVRRINTDPT